MLWQSNNYYIFCVCVCVCVCVALVTQMQSACVVLYCHLYLVRLYHIYSHNLITARFSGKSYSL